MSRRGLNKPIVGDGVQITSGTQNPNGTGGSSMTPYEKDGVNGELIHVNNTISANWVSIRYFAVDYDLGNDENIGFSDISMAVAGTVALKTIEELLTRVPRCGNGQTVVIAIKTRAGGTPGVTPAPGYFKKDGITPDRLLINGFYGYFFFLVRGTGTVATASATAFANDTADKIALGSEIAIGTDVAGYTTTGPNTVSVITVTPATLLAEPSLIGKRIRFSSTTTTVALRNFSAMIHANTVGTITVADDLPAIPAITDVFYIEEPGVSIELLSISSNTPNVAIITSLAFQGIQIAGIRLTGIGGANRSVIFGTSLCQLSFIDSANDQFTAFSLQNFIDVRFTRTYNDETGVSIITGVGTRVIGGINVIRGTQLVVTSSALVGPGATLGRVQVLTVFSIAIGGGCYFFSGVLYQGGGTGTSAVGSTTANLIGRGTSITSRRLRILATVGTPITGLNVSLSDCQIYGVDITGAGVNSMIILRGVGEAWSINDVVGATGNTGSGLDLTFAKDCSVAMGTLAVNTFTGAVGQDIIGAGTVFYVHADYGVCDLRDNAGNHIQGASAALVDAGTIIGTTVLVSNNGVAGIAKYKIVRPTASGVVQASIATAVATALTCGVTQGAPSTVQNTMLVNGGGTWIQFDVAPTAGDIAYLSEVTAGNAKSAPPPVAATNQKLRIGRVLRVSGTLGYVNFNPEILSVLADGAA